MSRPADEAWVIVADWSSSSATVHGPWLFAEYAETWAARNLEPDRDCTSWRLDILQRPDSGL